MCKSAAVAKINSGRGRGGGGCGGSVSISSHWNDLSYLRKLVGLHGSIWVHLGSPGLTSSSFISLFLLLLFSCLFFISFFHYYFFLFLLLFLHFLLLLLYLPSFYILGFLFLQLLLLLFVLHYHSNSLNIKYSSCPLSQNTSVSLKRNCNVKKMYKYRTKKRKRRMYDVCFWLPV